MFYGIDTATWVLIMFTSALSLLWLTDEDKETFFTVGLTVMWSLIVLMIFIHANLNGPAPHTPVPSAGYWWRIK